jgi:glycosyltransferase involved in cell wall biosynthesis
VVIIDDASRDSTFELTRAFIEENPIPQPVYLIRNSERVSALPNIYRAASEYCAPEDVLVLVDGDDELLGVNVLKVFNSMYSRRGLEVLYSNFINSNRRGRKVRLGWSSGYDPEEKKFSVYRESSTRMFPLRSFRVSTFLRIPLANLQDDAGEFFRSAYDQTICPQVLELSCGRNDYLREYHYFRNAGLGNNDMEVDPELNFRIVYTVRNKRKRLDCDPL